MDLFWKNWVDILFFILDYFWIDSKKLDLENYEINFFFAFFLLFDLFWKNWVDILTFLIFLYSWLFLNWFERKKLEQKFREL